MANRVYTQWLPHEHELVHATRSGDSARFFEEGLAIYWGDDIDLLAPLQGDVHDAIASSSDSLALDDASLAGHFVASLVERFDAPTVLELDRSTSLRDDYEAVESAFADAFPVSIDEAIDEYESTYPKCEHLVFRSAFFECEQAPMTLCDGDDASAEFTLDVSCGNEQALGPRQGTIWVNVAVDLARAGEYRIEGIQAPDVTRGFMRLKRCAGSCAGQVYENETKWPTDVFVGAIVEDLEAGRYVLQVHQQAEHPGEVRVVVECP